MKILCGHWKCLPLNLSLAFVSDLIVSEHYEILNQIYSSFQQWNYIRSPAWAEFLYYKKYQHFFIKDLIRYVKIS